MSEQQSPIDQAIQAIAESQVSLSTPQATPLFVWSRVARTGNQIKESVEAQGNAPYKVLAGWPLPREFAVQIPGRPPDMPHCWLIVVQIRARFGEIEPPRTDEQS